MISLRFLVILRKIYEMTHIDIFFLDWEGSYYDEDSHDQKKSVWRTISVASCFAELIKERHISVRISLLFLGMVIT
jgi:hypothetical protein